MRQTLLCETVTGRTMAELRAARDAADQADLVELRLDGVSDADVAAALAGRGRPVVVTCRPTWEGGRFEGSEEERRRLLSRALELGADYVDLEWKAGFDALVQQYAPRIVLSSHDFTGVPVDLSSRVRAMRQTGAAIVKLAITPSRLSDNLLLMDAAREGNAIVIGMGESGVTSRLLASRFGSCWSYGGAGVAPGQIPVSRMLGEFRFRHLQAETTIYGVVSRNAMHSLSPCMHNAALAAAGLDAVYVPLVAADFEDFQTFADALGVRGASVTIPFKLDALRAAADADDLTRRVGAANTIRRADDGWTAMNSDVAGFRDPLEAMCPFPLAGARAAILGAGGAARAVVVALVERGAHVTVYARRDAQADEIARAFDVGSAPWPPPPRSWDLLVNCTPLGGATAVDTSPLPAGPFDGRVVYDLTYGDRESPFLRAARDAGCLTLDGLPMLVAQAERQFEWWTGMRPGRDVMREAAFRRIARD